MKLNIQLFAERFIIFEDLPSTNTPLTAENLNNNFDYLLEDAENLNNNFEYLYENIGDVAELETDSKTNIVNSVNEIVDRSVFSTDEKIIGKWIDGKPLYQKTIQMPTVSAGTTGTYNISDLNCDTVWIDFGNSFAYSGEIVLPINRTHTGNIASQSDVRITRSTITIVCGSGTSAGYPIITIKYTKTTD